MTDRTPRDVGPRERLPEIAHEQLDEPGTVPPLQRQFLVVNDDHEWFMN